MKFRGGDPPAPARRRGFGPRLPSLLAVGAAGAVLLASCSSNANSPAAHSTTTTTTSRHATTTTTAPTATTVPSTTTTTGAAAAAQTCEPSQLGMGTGQGTGAAGTQTLTVTMTNTSAATCSLDGYPGMQLLNAQGAAITTTVVRGGFNFPAEAAADQSPSPVELAPSSVAAFSLAYEDVPVGNQTSCPVSSQVEVTPPNDYTHVVIGLSIAPCNDGTIHVSPVYSDS